jgi:uncharacterized protein
MRGLKTEFFTGLLFGVGLIVAGMTNPAKVLGFLDITGAWDPSLALVMGGAIAVGLVAFGWARHRTHSLCGGAMHLPGTQHLTPRLVLGSMAFGAGWGLAGFCPGPALVSAASGQPQAVVFVLAMLGGMLVFDGVEHWRHARRKHLPAHPSAAPSGKAP